VLAPVKKVLRTVFVVLAVRDVVLEVGKTLAMGHVLDRMLRTGALPDAASAAERLAEAARLRRALDAAYAGVDQRLVRRAVAAARRLPGHVIARLRERLTDGAVAVVDADDDLSSFLQELDRRVDLALLGRLP